MFLLLFLGVFYCQLGLRPTYGRRVGYNDGARPVMQVRGSLAQKQIIAMNNSAVTLRRRDRREVLALR